MRRAPLQQSDGRRSQILSEGGKNAFYIAAQHLAPDEGKTSSTPCGSTTRRAASEALSQSPPTSGASGNLQGGALLPSNAANYHKCSSPARPNTRPTKPGPVVLRGPNLALH